MKDILSIVQERYTTKNYDPNKKIPAEIFEKLMEVLRLTPSSTNVQPWHFVVAQTEDAKRRIAKSMEGSDYYNIPKVMNASHIVVMCSLNDVSAEHLEKVTNAEILAGRFSEENREQNTAPRANYVELYRSQGKIPMWVENQTHIALGQLLLASAIEGVDSTAIGGFQTEVLDKELNLAEKGFHSSVIVALGYRSDNDANASKPKGRLSKEEIISYL